MNPISKYISSQFKRPRGIVGSIICRVQNVVNRSMYNGLVSLLPFDTMDNILDIGYGNGRLLKKVFSHKQVELYGIDISRDAQKMAKRTNAIAQEAGMLHLLIGDCCDLPFSDNSFSVVTSINTVYFWKDTVQGLKEIHRVLRSGHSFYNTVFTREYLDTIGFTENGYRKFEVEELIHLGYEAGFNKVEVREIIKDKSLVVIYTK